ncbi:MAG: hypothetical protein ACLU18_24220 [Bacteroides thetaiotaomicron]
MVIIRLFYRTHGKPLFFIYDSYLIKPAEWAKLFAAGGRDKCA